MGLMSAHQPPSWAMGAPARRCSCRLIIAEVVAIRSGHRAGSALANVRRFLFRAARANAYANACIAAFAVQAEAGVLSAASPHSLDSLA
jgi:hypothetical protein